MRRRDHGFFEAGGRMIGFSLICGSSRPLLAMASTGMAGLKPLFSAEKIDQADAAAFPGDVDYR